MSSGKKHDPMIRFECPAEITAFIDRGIELKKWVSRVDALRDMLRTYLREHPDAIKIVMD